MLLFKHCGYELDFPLLSGQITFSTKVQRTSRAQNRALTLSGRAVRTGDYDGEDSGRKKKKTSSCKVLQRERERKKEREKDLLLIFSALLFHHCL